MFMPYDIQGIEDVMCDLCRNNSAQACAVLRALACCVDHTDTEKAIDYWCQYITDLDTDLCADDLGSVFRIAARFFDKQADNYRDEHATTEVYR